MREYENQLAAVDAAIVKDPTNDEWKRLRADLLEVIALKQQLVEVQGEAAQPPPPASAGEGVSAAAAADGLKSYEIGEKCQAVFEQDGNWYNAKVVALSEDGYFVTYLGYGNTAQVDFAEVRPYVRPDTSEWKVGGEVTAINPTDNRWYEGRIVNVKTEVATVRFTGDAELHEIDIDAIRLQPSASSSAAAAALAAATAAAAAASSSDAAASSVPKQMEIKPDDSEEVVQRKKKKLAMFKRQEKRVKEEKAGDERRNSWQSFKGKNKTITKAKNHHDPTWDPTRDHGEMQGRIQMDKFAKYVARNDH